MGKRIAIWLTITICTSVPVCADGSDSRADRAKQLKYQAQDLDRVRLALKQQLSGLLDDREEVQQKIEKYQYKLKNLNRAIDDLRKLDDRLWAQLKVVDAEYRSSAGQ